MPSGAGRGVLEAVVEGSTRAAITRPVPTKLRPETSPCLDTIHLLGFRGLPTSSVLPVWLPARTLILHLHWEKGKVSSDPSSKVLTDEVTSVEEAIYQTRNRSNQDPLNYPIRLNNKIAALSGVVAQGDNKPTDQAYAVFEELSAALQVQLDRMDAVLRERIPAFNAAVGALDLPAVGGRGN
jgi:hypothetical protein